MKPERGRSNPWLYFLIAYLYSWAVWSPPIIFGWEWGELRTLISFALGFGPLLAALLLVYRGHSEERPGEFWRRVYEVRRIPLTWLLVIIALPFGLNLLARVVPAGANETDATSLTIGGLVFIVLVFGFGAAFAEELGWRGYALDPLQRAYSALFASLIVGLAWGFWHLPLFFIEGTYQQELGVGTVDFWLFMAWTPLWSILYTWIYNHTSRSILAMILLHAFVNIASEIISPEGNQVYARMIVLAVFTVLVVLVWGARTLTRPADDSMRSGSGITRRGAHGPGR
jgi:uncharacterized protein